MSEENLEVGGEVEEENHSGLGFHNRLLVKVTGMVRLYRFWCLGGKVKDPEVLRNYTRGLESRN